MNNVSKLVLKAVALGMGISTLVLNILGSIEVSSSIILLSIGLICLSLLKFQEK